jgi:hypothetical protein
MTNFTPAGVVAMNPSGESQYFLGPNIANYQRLPESGLAIFRRKHSSPLEQLPSR